MVTKNFNKNILFVFFPLRNWIERHAPLGDGLRLVTSPSIRAVETANLVLPKAAWTTDGLVRGQVWGGIECLPWSEWSGVCKSNGYDTLPSGFHQAYPNGEALAEVWKRTRKIIKSLD